MKGPTHITIGLIVYFSYLLICDYTFSRSSLGLAVIMSLLPDIDSPYSMVSRSTIFTQAISEKINVALGHRGPLHSLFFRGVITVILRFLHTNYYVSYVSYVTGSLAYLSHIIADAFTPKGVPLFRPVTDMRVTICKKRGVRKSLCVKTGGAKEEALQIFLAFILLILIGLYMGLYPRDFTRPSSVFP